MRRIVTLALLALPITACGGSSDTPETPESDTHLTEAAEAETPDNLQIVQVRVEGNEYLFSPASVEAGKPVRLVFDPSGLPGCSRDVTLPHFEITKFIEDGNATIEFTPETAEPVAVACTMDMYRGTLLVQ